MIGWPDTLVGAGRFAISVTSTLRISLSAPTGCQAQGMMTQLRRVVSRLWSDEGGSRSWYGRKLISDHQSFSAIQSFLARSLTAVGPASNPFSLIQSSKAR